MTVPTNTFLTFSAIGNREDLTDVIYNISPTETPFMNMCGKAKAEATNHEWQTDTLAAAADNKNIQGDDAVNDAVAATTRLGNRTQIADKVVQISGTQDAVNTAGRKKELAYQIAKRGKELKRDMETTLVGTNKAKVTGNSTTASELATVLSWIKTNVDKASDGTNPTGDGTDARGDGTQRAFTESLLKNAIQLAWTSGGSPDTIMVGAFNKRVISSFTGNATRMTDATDKKLIAAIDVYVSDFGDLKIVPNRFMRSRDALILDFEYWAIAYLRGMSTWDLAKTGDSTRKQLLCEYTLEARNEAGSAIVADLTTS
jgi:hypothetical protein